MASFVNFANNFISGNGNWSSLPRMIQDCVMSHSQLRDCKEYNSLQSPLLRVFSGNPYTPVDIHDGLSYLLDLDIHSFVVIENSTYALQLLEQLFSIPEESNLRFSCSCSQRYYRKVTDRWGSPREIHGIVVKITERKTVVRGKALPSDIIS